MSNSSQGVSYQTAILPQTVLEQLTVDDTPDLFYNYFWEFMGVDIQNANIMPWDFDNILDMIDIKVCEILQEYPEESWDDVVIVKYKKRIQTGRIIKEPIYAFHLTILWSSMKAKAYLKMCRAREGFALRQITETKGHLTQHQKIEGGDYAVAAQQDNNPQKNKDWKL